MQSSSAPESPTRILAGMAAGMAGGVVGAWTMVRFNRLLGGIESNRRRSPPRRRHASPNQDDGTISDEPATRKAPSAVAERVIGRGLSEREKDVAGPASHLAFGGLVGAVYGAASEWTPGVASGAGLLYGAAVWLFAAELGLPAAGLALDPRTYPASRHAASLASHLVYGLTLEATRRVIRGAPRHWTARA
jgi:hypothetical protein